MALVTGGSGGIGSALVAGLARRGDAVAFTYSRGRDKASVLERTWRETGWTVLAIQADVRQAESVDQAFTAAESHLGPVEILINNAGIRRDQLGVRLSDDAWADVLETNLSGPFRCIRRALPQMIRHRFGRIVSVGSAAAMTGSPGQANYAASKAGLIGLSRVIAREVASRNITCNVVSPGPIDTEMIADITPEDRARLATVIPARRFGTIDEVAATVVHLCGDDAGYITGAVIPIDGGLAMGH